MSKGKQHRNFVFFYQLSNGMHSTMGNIWLKRMTRFPSNAWICEQATKNDPNFESTDVIITGWKEMTDQDFKEFEEGHSGV